MGKIVVTLKDGTRFTGHRGWGEYWMDGLSNICYTVLQCDNSNIPVGSVIRVQLSSINYRIRIGD